MQEGQFVSSGSHKSCNHALERKEIRLWDNTFDVFVRQASRMRWTKTAARRLPFREPDQRPNQALGTGYSGVRGTGTAAAAPRELPHRGGLAAALGRNSPLGNIDGGVSGFGGAAAAASMALHDSIGLLSDSQRIQVSCKPSYKSIVLEGIISLSLFHSSCAQM